MIKSVLGEEGRKGGRDNGEGERDEVKEFHVVLALLEYEHREIFQAHATCYLPSSEISHFSRDSGLLYWRTVLETETRFWFLGCFCDGAAFRHSKLEGVVYTNFFP